MRGITIYSKAAGLEVLGNDIQKKGYKYGAITLRFFKLENGSNSVRFILTPPEAFKARLLINKVLSISSGKLSITHRFEKEGQEFISSLLFEKWVREEKSGFAVNIKRDDISINVPMTDTDFMYLGELFRYLSTQQAWVNPIEPAEKEEVATEGTAELDEDPLSFHPEPDAPADTAPVVKDDAAISTPPTTPPVSANPTVVGEVQAIRKDGKGVKVADDWFSINERTQLDVTLKKGIRVAIEYRNGNSGKFANKITQLIN